LVIVQNNFFFSLFGSRALQFSHHCFRLITSQLTFHSKEANITRLLRTFQNKGAGCWVQCQEHAFSLSRWNLLTCARRSKVAGRM